jgi:hypothetical protein
MIIGAGSTRTRPPTSEDELIDSDPDDARLP